MAKVPATTVKNTAGFYYAETNNDDIVMRALPIGNQIIVYTMFSVFVLTPHATPAPTYGVTKLIDVGISNPLAVGGNEKKHLMVDRLGYLWFLGTDSKAMIPKVAPQRLGFSEFLEPMTRDCDISTSYNVISVVFNEEEDEFYISNGVESYKFDGESLTEMSMCISGIFNSINTALKSITGTNSSGLSPHIKNISKVPVGFKQAIGEQCFLYKTDILDFGVNGIKTIEGVDLGISLDLDNMVEVMVEWRNDRGSEFYETAWKRCSPDGACAPLVSGSELRICVSDLS